MQRRTFLTLAGAAPLAWQAHLFAGPPAAAERQADVVIVGGSTGGCAAALAAGAQIAVRSAPSLSNYWAVAKETGATIALGVSTMAAFLLARPPGPVT